MKGGGKKITYLEGFRMATYSISKGKTEKKQQVQAEAEVESA